ncbi:hypothetical protein OC845_004883 [Tilletia horrida]|nr:hypothetical protein OC845_004883 [Tilletia horrida]
MAHNPPHPTDPRFSIASGSTNWDTSTLGGDRASKFSTDAPFTAPPSDPPALSSSRLKHPGALINIYNDLNNSSDQQQPWPASNGEPFANTNSAIGPPPQPPSHPAPPQRVSNSVPTLSVSQGNGAFSGNAFAHNATAHIAAASLAQHFGPQGPQAHHGVVPNSTFGGGQTNPIPPQQLPSHSPADGFQSVNHHPNTPAFGGANTNLSPPLQDVHGRSMFSPGSAASGSQPATPHLAAPIGQYPQFSAYRNGQGVVPSPAPSPLASISGGLSPAATSPGAPSPGGVSPLATSLGVFLNLAQAHDDTVNGPIGGQQSGVPLQTTAGRSAILAAQNGRNDRCFQGRPSATPQQSTAKRKLSHTGKKPQALTKREAQKKWRTNTNAQSNAVQEILRYLVDSKLDLIDLFGTEDTPILSTLFPATDGANNEKEDQDRDLCRFTLLTRLLVEYIETGKVEEQPEKTRDHLVPLLAAFVGDTERSDHLCALEDRLHKDLTAKWAKELRDAGEASSSNPIPALPCLPLQLRALYNRNMFQLRYHTEHHTGLKVAIQRHLYKQKNLEHQVDESPSNSTTAPDPDFTASWTDQFLNFP